MEKNLKIYTYVDGIKDVPFPSINSQIEIYTFNYDTKRMGGAPLISGSILYPTCLDNVWNGRQYVFFNGEKYFIKYSVPSSSYSNEDSRYKHDVQFVSERIILDNIYFFDVVTDPTDNDKYVSNSSKVDFFGDIHEFATRLNYSLKYSKAGYSVVVDEGISTEAFMMSFEDQFFSQVLQSIFEIYQVPYYYVGKVIHIGFTNNAITRTFKYGAKDALLSISKTNANYKIVNRITGIGSTDNIPYYYPNPSDDRTAIEAAGGTWITPSANLMPPIYRESFGAERFYNAKNDTYISPETGEYYIFENQYRDGNPKEHKVSFENIKPTIKEMVNAEGLRIDVFEEFAYDLNDNDEVDKEGNYIHPYFFGKLRKFDGVNGFNLFEQAIEKGEMTISMTSGNCGACNWIIGVDEDTQKNPVQVHTNGDLLRDKDGNVLRSGKPQDIQNNTQTNSVWIALKKDIESFGVVMPNATNNYKPTAKSDTFVILNIDLPQAYITSAENKLKEEMIKYMATNNSDKFTFSVSFSRIFFAENPNILALLNENARLQIEYNSKLYELYISSYSYKMSSNETLPQITVELADTLTINKGTLQTSIDAVKQDIMNSVGGGDFLKQGLKYFVRKDVKDYAKFVSFRDGIDIGNFESLLSGGTFRKDADGKSYIEVDRLYVRLKAIFENLEIKRTTYVGGEQIASPAAMKCIRVQDRETVKDSVTGEETVEIWSYYRCYYLNEQDGKKIQNEFVINDQAICKESNLKSGSNISNRYYWRLVVGIGDGYIDLSKEKRDLASNDAPLAGDDIVQLGNTTDVTRQKAIIQSTVALDAPSIKLLAGINSFSLEGKSIISQGFDSITGRATFNVYGDSYIGNRDGSSFIRYTPEKGVEINATLSIGTKFGEEGNTLLYSLNKATQDAIDASSSALTDYAAQVTKDFEGIQDQLDGAIETWFFDPVPTLSNKPAVEWTTNEIKNTHLGDLYYSKEGKAYRFQMDGASYIWQVLADTDIVKALENAKKAQDTADGKRKVFVRQPLNTEDYAIGDLWANATYSTTYKNDLLRCKTAKAINAAFSIAHWELASKYTDDTKALEAVAAAEEANQAAEAASAAAATVAASVTTLNDYVDGAFKDGVITTTEAQTIATYINTINNNKLSVDNQYAKLYANVYLTDPAKTNLLSAKTALDTATTNLLSSINTAIADGNTTDAEKADVDAKFIIYNTANATFSTRVEEANKAIQDKLKTYSDEASLAAAEAAAAASNAQNAANTANGLLSDIASDSKLTASEKQETKKEWDIIVSEKPKNDASADFYGVAKATYGAAYNALNTYITPLLSSLTTTSEITGATFRDTFKTYYDARTDLLNAISAKAKELADKAQSTADGAIRDIAGYQYLKQALNEKTSIDGGLILSSNVSLGQTVNGAFTVRSGINGIYNTAKPGNGISYWAGGAMKDIAEDYPLPWANNTPPKPSNPNLYAKSVIRMDGTGYFAGGNMWIDADGKIHCDPLSFFVGEQQVGDILSIFTPIRTSSGLVGARQNVPFEDGTGKALLKIGKFVLSEDNNGNLGLTKSDGTPATFFVTGGLSAKGISNSGGGGGGLDVARMWRELASLGTEQIAKNHLTDALVWGNISSKPSWIGATKPTYNYSEIVGTPSITELNYFVDSIDARGDMIYPNTYDKAARFLFRSNSIDGLDNGGTYHGVLHFRAYGISNDFSGGRVHQLGFTDAGNLYHRVSNGTNAWYSWQKILNDTNYAGTLDNAYVKKSGDTMTGSLTVPWGSLIVGDAGGDTYGYRVLKAYNVNTSASTYPIYLNFGHSPSAGNCGELGFHYTASSSTSNYVTLGFYGAAQLKLYYRSDITYHDQTIWHNGNLPKNQITRGIRSTGHGVMSNSYSGVTYIDTYLNDDYGAQIRRGSWDYANNGYIITDYGNIHLAGTTVIASGANQYRHLLFITPPTTAVGNGMKNEMLFYTTNGNSTEYPNAWTRVLTNRNYNYYAPTLKGTGATGWWDININGASYALTNVSTTDGNNLTDLNPSAWYWNLWTGSAVNTPAAYAFGINLRAQDNRYGFQLASTAFNDTLYFRKYNASIYRSWKEVAFTDGTIDWARGISSTNPQLAAGYESNEIVVANNNSISALNHAIKFRWYTNYYQLGIIRDGGTGDQGFAICRDTNPIVIFKDNGITANYTIMALHTNSLRTSGGLLVNTKKLATGSYSEGIRLIASPNGWSNIQFNAGNAWTGYQTGQWIIGRNSANAFIIASTPNQTDTTTWANGNVVIDASGNIEAGNYIAHSWVRANKFDISSSYGTCYMNIGNGDNASYTTHNLIIRSWWGIGIHDNGNNCNIVFDARSGSINSKGSIACSNNMSCNGNMSCESSLRIGQCLLRYNATNNALYITKSDGGIINFYSTGGVSAKGFSGAVSSDITLKNKINDINIPIETIANAPFFNFKWKDKSIDEDIHIGTSAQYWNEHLPYSTNELPHNKKLALHYAEVALLCSIQLAKDFIIEKTEKQKMLERIKQLEEKVISLEKIINSAA